MNVGLEGRTSNDLSFPPATDPIRVLLWSPYGACVQSGGAGLSASRLYSAKRSDNFQVTLAHGLKNHPEVPCFDECVQIGDLKRPSSVFNHVKFLVSSAVWLYFNAKNFDVFHGIDTFEATITPAMWAKRLGLSVIVKPANHGKHSGTAPSKSWRKIFQRPAQRLKSMKKFDKIIAISSSIAEELDRGGIPRGKITRIPNGVDIDRFTTPSNEDYLQARKLLGIEKNSFMVLCVSGVRPVKRLEWLIRSVAALENSGEPIELHVLGLIQDPVYSKDLKQLIETLSVGNSVYFHPETSGPETYFQAADLFCLASSFEGLSNALLEAMASSLPVISTPVSGSIDVVCDGKNGFLIENEEMLANSIRKLRSDSSLRQRMGIEARNTIINDYSMEQIWQMYSEMIGKVRKRAIR